LVASLADQSDIVGARHERQVIVAPPSVAMNFRRPMWITYGRKEAE
jgi:hypothetical protein